MESVITAKLKTDQTIKVVQCRNRIESGFETLIIKFINSRVKLFENVSTTYSQDNLVLDEIGKITKIEDIVDYYLENEKELDTECMIRGFITSIHYSTDEESSKLSKWFFKVRPDIVENISAEIMLVVLDKKIVEFMRVKSKKFPKEIDLDFFTKYLLWLVQIYVLNKKPERYENSVVFLSALVDEINEKMKYTDADTDPNITERVSILRQIKKQRIANLTIEVYPKFLAIKNYIDKENKKIKNNSQTV